ncbi:MAG: extracellular solute-binding protein [Clostridia bacterium]|nr:extracellular solute-binding protein [Clostridia bacterium]
MKIKRILSVALALCLVAALALAAGCSDGGSGNTGSKDSGSKSGNTGTASATVENIYGAGLSEDTISALQDSGTISMYTMYQNQVNSADWTDEFREEMEFYKKYYGLTIKWKYQAYGDDLSKFMVDYANGDAPDGTLTSYRRWPKAGIRQVIYTLDELKDLGVVGLDHPEITRYEDVTDRFTIGGKKYAAGLYYTTPSICVVNTDLFDEYKVKSPIEYYKEGNWNLDTYMECCKNITRTLADGTKIWGSAWRDHTYYLVANDARLVDWNDKETRLVLTMKDTKCVKALEVFRDSFVNGYSPSAEEGGGSTFFKLGRMGIFIHDANNYAQGCKDYSFHWEVIPTPLGSDNVSGNIPGECSGCGIVTSTKNPQGILNYYIAHSQWLSYKYQQPYGVFYVDTFQGVYNDEQLKMICESAQHIGHDLYWGCGNITNIQWNFWNNIKGEKQTIKEAMDTYEPLFQAELDAENEFLAKMFP